MGFKIVVKDEVWQDVQDAIMWYEQKSIGLGERFFKSFEKTFQKIFANPAHYSFITMHVRRCIIYSFPYSIHYIFENDTIFVLGVIHRKRSNAYIRKRFKNKQP